MRYSVCLQNILKSAIIMVMSPLLSCIKFMFYGTYKTSAHKNIISQVIEFNIHGPEGCLKTNYI